MLKIEKGGEYKAARVRSGASERGDWELVVVKAEGRTRQEMTFFPDNAPTGIKEGGQFTVGEITSVTLKKRKDRDGNWTKEEVTLTGKLEAVESVDLDDISTSSYDDLYGSSDFDGFDDEL